MPSGCSTPRLSLRAVLRKGAAFGPGKAELLEHVRDTGSIAAGGRAMNMAAEHGNDPPGALQGIAQPRHAFHHEGNGQHAVRDEVVPAGAFAACSITTTCSIGVAVPAFLSPAEAPSGLAVTSAATKKVQPACAPDPESA